MTSSEWIFPHSTCERTLQDHLVLQPWSFGVNLLNVALLGRYAIISQSTPARLAILSFILFEILHSFSHAIHYDRQFHEIGIHVAGYLMAITSYIALKNETKYTLTFTSKLIIFLSILIDLIIFSTVRSIYGVASGLNLLTVTVAQFFHVLQPDKRILIQRLIAGVVVLFFMFVIEKHHCAYFMRINFQYHPFIVEPWGLILFQMLASVFMEESKNLKHKTK
jgi:hypothetical protein